MIYKYHTIYVMYSSISSVNTIQKRYYVFNLLLNSGGGEKLMKPENQHHVQTIISILSLKERECLVRAELLPRHLDRVKSS